MTPLIFNWISPILLVKGDEIFRDYDRHTVETVILIKYVTEYEQMWKWMVEFLTRFQGRGVNIDRVNSIRVVKPLIFFNILRAVAR